MPPSVTAQIQLRGNTTMIEIATSSLLNFLSRADVDAASPSPGVISAFFEYRVEPADRQETNFALSAWHLDWPDIDLELTWLETAERVSGARSRYRTRHRRHARGPRGRQPAQKHGLPSSFTPRDVLFFGCNASLARGK